MKSQFYAEVKESIAALCEGEFDEVALMATVACELHHKFDDFHWTGFYRCVEDRLLKVGPYQGGHGCLAIPFERGVCGACASEEVTQIVEDVDKLPYHIACSSTTKSEIVVPVFNAKRHLIAVLDVDSDKLGAFDVTDRCELEDIVRLFSRLS